ncbi:MAG: UDP-glucose/GDP-mannose dehydrogenase family protein [Actinomycetota bacterium]|nr:UDP-glucose/GDP-mannose dehydrogenase family protein [Actinomycetota bacterium]
MSEIAIVGTGYVGLTAGACLAHLGHRVVCYDIDEAKIDKLSKGEIPIVEQGLEILVKEGLEKKRLSFVTDPQKAISESEVVFLCVQTPQQADGTTDISMVDLAVSQIVKFLPPNSVLVNKSTVPVGSAQKVFEKLQRPDVEVVSNPEFLREGSAVDDFLNPERIIIGSENQAAAQKVAEIYKKIEAPILITDPISAETIKYSANAFLVTKLSFINSIAAVCEGVGANIDAVIEGISYDSRIGDKYMKPGPGWGGSCFPKDTKSLIHMAGKAGYDFRFLDTAVTVNEEQFDRVANKIRDAVGGELKGKTVAVWGLTFKAGTDDLRDSPSIEVINRLLPEGAIVKAHDPTVPDHKEGIPSQVLIVDDPLKVCEEANVVVLLTDWDDYKTIEPKQVMQHISDLNLIDTRNVFNPQEWTNSGFTYQGMGR